MAHPDEPQRPLTGDMQPAASTTARASGMDAAGAVPPRPTLHEVLLAGTAFIVAFAIALAAYAVLVVPGPWFPNARTQSWKATDLKLVTGTGVLEGGTLVATASDTTNMVVVSLVTDLRSSEYPAIAWNVQRVPDGADVRMLWTTDIAPSRTNLAPVTVESGRLRPVVLTSDPAWVGRIKGIGLAVRMPLSEPIRIEAVSAKPMGVPQVVAEHVREWLTYEPFDGASINTIAGGADLQDLPLPPLAALAVALATLLLWAVHRKLPQVYAHGPAYTLAALFALAWFALDARWIANLARQTSVTLARYEGMAIRDKHAADDDGQLYLFIEKVRAAMPAAPARIFVAANAPYLRGRAAYHLYPHNVWFEPVLDALPRPEWLQAGDWLLVYQRRGVQFDATRKSLRWENGATVGAELKLVEPGAGLFQIRQPN